MDIAGVVAVERVRLSVLERGRPVAGRTLTVGAPAGCRLGVELDRLDPEDEPGVAARGEVPRVSAFRVGLTVEGAVPGRDPGADVLVLGALGFHDGLRVLLGQLRGPELAVEAWLSGGGEAAGPGVWVYVCAPWTVRGRPVLERTRTGVGGRVVEGVRWWQAQTRGGVRPWLEDSPAVHSSHAARKVARPRPDTHWYRAVVDLAPPPADVLPRRKGVGWWGPGSAGGAGRGRGGGVGLDAGDLHAGAGDDGRDGDGAAAEEYPYERGGPCHVSAPGGGVTGCQERTPRPGSGR